MAPEYKAYVGDIMRSSFAIRSEDLLGGSLICKLQRKQSHDSAVIDQDTSSIAQPLVVWNISGCNKSHVDILLVEHTKEFSWNEDKLRKLYDKNYDWLKECNDITSDT
jgi:hypothetical protein